MLPPTATGCAARVPLHAARVSSLLAMHQDQMLAIRVYLLGDRVPDAVDVYCAATGAERQAAARAVATIYDELRKEDGYQLLALRFRLTKSLTIGVPLAIAWVSAGCLWAWALDISVFRTAKWVFICSLPFGMLMAQTIKWKPHARAAGNIYGGLAIVAAVAALLVKVVRWMF